MDRTQDRVALVGLVGKEVLRQTNVQRERGQHARTEVVQRLVQAIARLTEARHFTRPQIRRHHLTVR